MYLKSMKKSQSYTKCRKNVGLELISLLKMYVCTCIDSLNEKINETN